MSKEGSSMTFGPFASAAQIPFWKALLLLLRGDRSRTNARTV